MTAPVRRSSGPIPRILLQLAAANRRALVQAAAALAACGFAYHGAGILNQYPNAVFHRFDEAAPWLGLALAAALVAAWQPPLPAVSLRALPGSLVDFWREHWIEISLLTAIFGFGVFMRIYRFGDTLPPANALCCEESINGGVAYGVLHGLRPVLFPLGRYSSAGGFLLFGENTLGLRFFFVAMGIATLVPFYLLLRQLVSVPAALFGFALFAAAWWPSLFSRQTSEGTIYAVLFALLLVRGLKTKSPLMALGAGIVAGLMSYEYEAFKQVPFIALAFVGAAVVREVLLRRPVRPDAVRRRAGAVLRDYWKPALIFLLGAGIVAVPLIVGISNDQNVYLTSLHRQEAGRAGGLFVSHWQQPLKWAAEVFSPFGPKEYPGQPPLDMPGMLLVDPLAAWLGLAGLLTALVLFWRPYRLLFTAWFVVTLASGALLLENFRAWKFIGLAPILMVLAALFVDDLRAQASRLFGARGRQAVAALLVLGAAFSFWWNADTLFRKVAPSGAVQPQYADGPSQFYAFCDYLRGRGAGNYTFAFTSGHELPGFALPHDTADQQQYSWGDIIWACHDLRGAPLPAIEEAWPLRSLPPGPVTLAFIMQANAPVRKEKQLIEELNSVYPGLGQPNGRIEGAANLFSIVGYGLPDASKLDRRGLAAEYVAAGAQAPALVRTDPVADLSWDQAGLPLPPPFTVRWRGLIYVEQPGYVEQFGRMSLRAETDDPVEVRVDGQVTQDSRSGLGEVPLDLVPGWHLVEITLDKQRPGGRVALRWVAATGQASAVRAADLFPLTSRGGWLHRRVFEIPATGGTFETQRLDFAPHTATELALKPTARPGVESIVKEDRYSGVWDVEQAGEYELRLKWFAGRATIRIDGREVLSSAAAQPLDGLAANVTLAAGPHRVELLQQLDGETHWTGMRLEASRLVAPSPAPAAPLVPMPVQMQVRPY